MGMSLETPRRIREPHEPRRHGVPGGWTAWAGATPAPSPWFRQADDRRSRVHRPRCAALARVGCLLLASANAASVSRGASLTGTVLHGSYRTSAVREELRYEVYLPPGHSDGAGLPYLLFLPGFKDKQTYC